jgi:hypothetical protein
MNEDPCEAADQCAQAAADLDRQDCRALKLIPGVLAELRELDESSGEVPPAVLKARSRAQIALCLRLERIARRDIPWG